MLTPQAQQGQFRTRNYCGGLVLAAWMMLAGHALAAVDDAVPAARGLQLALASDDRAALYRDTGEGAAFALSTSTFNGRANQSTPLSQGLAQLDLTNQFNLDRAVELERDQRVYALLIDGTYDFNYELGEDSRLHPYVLGGVGMALYGQPTATSSNDRTGGDMVPLFRIGGGLAYRLGSQWNLSLDYKAGFSGSNGGDQRFTSRSQSQPVDLHLLNMGMSYRF